MKKFSKKFKKNILIFCPSIEEGGVEKNLINISNYLSNYFNVSLLTANKDKKKEFSSHVNFIAPSRNIFNKKKRFFKNLVCIYLFLKEKKFKDFKILSFQSNITAIILSILFQKKVIIRSNASPNFYARNFFKRFFFSFIFKFADKIIVNSDDFRREFKRYFNILPIRIYNPIENSNFIKKKMKKKIKIPFFSDKKNLKILSIGRLVKQKDHITLLKAVNLIKFKKKFKLLILGKGDQKNELQKFINENKLNNCVKILNYQKNIYPFLFKADLFILSSIYEGLPNVLIEALSSGTKIISSNCKSGPREILNKKTHGKLFNVGDYKKLARLITKTKILKQKKFIKDKRFDFQKNLLKYKTVLDF